MSFIDFNGNEDIPITGNPEITIFYKNQFDPELHKKLDTTSKIEKINKQNFSIANSLDYGVMYRHTPFDKSSVIITQDKFNETNNCNYSINKLNIMKELKLYNHIINMVFTFSKFNKTNKLYDLFNQICLTIGELPFNLTPHQIIIYNNFYKKIMYESDDEITFNLPISFFEGNGESLPILELLDIHLDVITKENITFQIEMFVVQVSQDEARKLQSYYKYSTLNRIINYTEELTTIINNTDQTTLLTNKNYPIKELFWTYNTNDNKIINASDNINMTLSNDKKSENKSLTKHQCCVTNQLSHFGNVLSDYYLYSFSCYPQTKHPTGELILSNNNLVITHNLNKNYNNMNISVRIIIFGIRMITFYHVDDDEKIKCKFTSIYDSIKNIA